MNAEELNERANSFLWSEILEPVGFYVIEKKPWKSLTAISWAHEDTDETIHYKTFGEESPLFGNKVDKYGSPVEAVTKYEAIRKLHFNKHTNLANQFFLLSASIVPSFLDEVAESRSEYLFDRARQSTSKERYLFDPLFRTTVDMEMMRLEAKQEATRRLNESKFASESQTPRSIKLTDFLKQEFLGEKFLVEGLIPKDGTTTFVASKKTGKTTLAFHLIDCLISEKTFLGSFDVNEFDGRIGYLNYELTERQSQEWFEKTKISDTDRLNIWNLRGKPSPFRSDLAIEKFVKEVREQEITVLLVDPFSGAYRGGKSMDNDEIKAFWLMMEAVKIESGVNELIMIVHAGWDGTRSRGASTLEDHPDSIIYLEKQADNVRTLRAEGRDVLVEIGELGFDEKTMSLVFKGPITLQTRVEKTSKLVLDLIKKSGPMSATDLTRNLKRNKDDVRDARELLLREGKIIMTVSGAKKLYSEATAYSPEAVPGTRADEEGSASTPSKGEATTHTIPDHECGSCKSKECYVEQLEGIKVCTCANCFEVNWIKDAAV
jgi:hypothetical protein